MTSTALATKCPSQFAPSLAGALHVERTDINFVSRRPDFVDIHVVVTNTGTDYSEPTAAALEAAPLGAFVPWRPLAMVPVPALAPGESFVVETQARRRRARSLGTPDRIPPRQFLVALGADDDEQPPRRSRVGTARDLLTILRPAMGAELGSAQEQRSSGELPADPFDLFSRGNPHWAGNLNIFIGGRAVERHMAQALRVYPGRTNLAFFIVGTGRDAYAFHLKGAAAEWEAALFDLTRARSLVPVDRQSLVPVDRWVEMSGHAMMILALHPPTDCSPETVEVHVTQRSTGETAIVEFSLDARLPPGPAATWSKCREIAVVKRTANQVGQAWA